MELKVLSYKYLLNTFIDIKSIIIQIIPDSLVKHQFVFKVKLDDLIVWFCGRSSLDIIPFQFHQIYSMTYLVWIFCFSTVFGGSSRFFPWSFALYVIVYNPLIIKSSYASFQKWYDLIANIATGNTVFFD